MSEELAVRRMDNEQVELVKNTIAKGCTSDELALFIEQCNRTQLDPFARQIYAVSRYDGKLGRPVMQTQVSIDGARLVAQRSGEYAGQTAVFYCGSDRQWTDLWLPEDGYPKAAKIGVYRRGFVEPLWATATWDQYVQTVKDGKPNRMWGQMGPLMLGKCAEMLALRKAFPMELSGLYSAEEMGQAENEAPAKAEVTKSSSRGKTEPATVSRSAPVQEEEFNDTGEQASVDELETFKTALSELTDDEKVTAKERLTNAGLWLKLNVMTSTQVDDALKIISGVFHDSMDVSVHDEEPVHESIVKPDEILPPLATDAQVRGINGLAAKLGFATREAVHARVSEIVGVEVTSVKNLTKAQAHKCMDQFTSDVEALK